MCSPSVSYATSDTLFVRWMRLFDRADNSDPDSDFKEHCFECMKKFAKTFWDWRNIFYREKLGSIEERTALLQMATHAKTFGHWLCILQEAQKREDCYDVGNIALVQLQKLADQPADVEAKKREALRLFRWTEILRACPRGSHIEYIAKNRVAQEILAEKAAAEFERVGNSPAKI